MQFKGDHSLRSVPASDSVYTGVEQVEEDCEVFPNTVSCICTPHLADSQIDSVPAVLAALTRDNFESNTITRLLQGSRSRETEVASIRAQTG